MNEAPIPVDAAIAPNVTAPQHGPRPLPLFLDILWRETHGDPELRRRAFAGLSRYQEAVRPAPMLPPRAAASVQNTRLLHYGTENGAKTDGRPSVDARIPVVFIPSLINPPTVLDLSEQQSMLRYLAALGHDPWLVDWGMPVAGEAALDLTGHIEKKLMPLIMGIGRPVILAGYCLGGTLALGLAGIMQATTAVVTIASPWNFDGFPPDAREEVARLWSNAKPVCARLGYVPMEVLQSGFWALDPARTVRKYAGFADVEPGSHTEQAFLALEDWANEGPPLTYAAGAELFDSLYAANVTGRGEWTVRGLKVAVKPDCPSLSIASLTDRIVPSASAPALDENWTLGLGHVGMIVSGRAREMLWDPLSRWLSKQGG